MKNFYNWMLVIVAFMATAIMGGCLGPPEVPPIEEIRTNETAFLVPMEGATKSGQQKFDSGGEEEQTSVSGIEYYKKKRVSLKRITIPVRKRHIGRSWQWWAYEWIDLMRVIKVDRTPITREWTQAPEKGTKNKDESICVESLDSIGFCVGVNITALIKEEDAATFLYYYSGKKLADIIDTNIRGFVQSDLAVQFGEFNLDKCKTQKREIFSTTYEEVGIKFLTMGITIENMGLADGLIYDDPEIQNSINARHVAEMDTEKAVHEREAQEERNRMNVEKAAADMKVAFSFGKAQRAAIARTELKIAMVRAEASKISASKWDGKLPSQILPANSPLLFNMGK